MLTLYKKEITSFFSSLIGYIAVGVFLLFMGLMTWVFPDFSILEYEFASLDAFFEIVPFIFMFLIPAITMSSFAQEKQEGTFELLATKPLTDLGILSGKFMASFTLIVISLLPTLLYVYTVYQLGSPKGNIDLGAVLGSYIGMFLLAAAFCAIGLFASSLSSNQIVGFIVGFFLCFMLYMSFDFIAHFPLFLGNLDNFIEELGMSYHYSSINSGLIDSRDVLYFLSIIALFFIATLTVIAKRNWK